MQGKISSLRLDKPQSSVPQGSMIYMDIFGSDPSRDWKRSIRNLPDDVFLKVAQQKSTKLVYEEMLSRFGDLCQEKEVLTQENICLKSHLTPYLDRAHYLSKYPNKAFKKRVSFHNIAVDKEDINLPVDRYIFKHVPYPEIRELFEGDSSIRKSVGIFTIESPSDTQVFKRILKYSENNLRLAIYLYNHRELCYSTVKFIKSSILKFSEFSNPTESDSTEEYQALRADLLKPYIFHLRYTENKPEQSIKTNVKHIKKFIKENYELSASKLCLLEVKYPLSMSPREARKKVKQIERAYLTLIKKNMGEEALCLYLNYSLRLGIDTLCSLQYNSINKEASEIVFFDKSLKEKHQMRLDPITLKLIEDHHHQNCLSLFKATKNASNKEIKEVKERESNILKMKPLHYKRMYKSRFGGSIKTFEFTPLMISKISETADPPSERETTIKVSRSLISHG